MILVSSPVVKDSLWCCACERSVSGLRYSCTATGDVLHPCCARLPKSCTISSITSHLYTVQRPCSLFQRGLGNDRDPRVQFI
ncbi:hypothetical protein SUGI_0671610 [Cryptomeria japonica]|nr:hypothetical protein SUGI_0671610 [Cryptomeria japonica]